MKEIIRLQRAELWKMRHTITLALHFIIPAAGIIIFLLYYRGSVWSDEQNVEGYIQILSCIFPFVISIICGLAVRGEKTGRFQTLLTVSSRKGYALLAKASILSLLGLGAVTLAVGGFAAGYKLLIHNLPYSIYIYCIVIFAQWACSIPLYLFHLFLSLQFSENISIGIGVFGSLLSSLMLTGLGEGVWQFIPSAWGGRWSGILLLYSKNHEAGLHQMIFETSGKNGIICMAIAVFVAASVFIWFQFYEGRQGND